MSKPWEDSWEAREDDVWCPAERVVVARETDEADAKLIAAAPEMARMLLELQWAAADSECPLCYAEPYTEDGWKNDAPHASHCRLAALLRKAGVKP